MQQTEYKEGKGAGTWRSGEQKCEGRKGGGGEGQKERKRREAGHEYVGIERERRWGATRVAVPLCMPGLHLVGFDASCCYVAAGRGLANCL